MIEKDENYDDNEAPSLHGNVKKYDILLKFANKKLDLKEELRAISL